MEVAVIEKVAKANVGSIIKKYPGVFKRVDDIEIPEILFHPIKTGTREFDSCFSELGGVTPSCVTMVTGTPGAGKTTLMSVMGSRLISPRPVVFLSYEMSDFQLKMQARKIPGFNNMLIVTEPFHKDTAKFEDFLKMLADLNPALVVVDSLQKMAGVMAGSFDKAQIYLAEKFTNFAKETYVPVCLIGHVNKDGSYKGPTTILHEVDAHLHVFVDKDLGERMFQMGKNRFGGVTDPYVFRITNHGVFIGEEWWLKQSANMGELKEELKAAVSHFKAECSKSEKVPFKAFQEVSKTAMTYLTTKYGAELREKSVAKTADVKLTYTGRRAFCQAGASLINFGPKFFNFKSHTTVGYKQEKPIIQRYCKSTGDVCMWVIFHEFQHLYAGYQHHRKSFFTALEAKVKEDQWLFEL